MKGRILLYSILIFTVSCSKPTTALENALVLAKNNRGELEKILIHYSTFPEDSLKFQAACFLIENMPLHYSYKGESVDYYYSEISKLHKGNGSSASTIINEINDLNAGLVDNGINISITYDIQSIKAEYLISHIDAAFESRSYPWNKNVSFDDFCEYVLPYRISNEPVCEWLPIYRAYTKNIADSIYSETDSDSDFISQLIKRFSTPSWWVERCNYNVDLPPDFYINIKYGTCYELAAWGAYTFKALGIPIFWDYTPNWANRSLDHHWNGIIVDNKYYAFQFLDICAFGDHMTSYPHRNLPKTFRKTYKYQTESLKAQYSNNNIPRIFNNAFIRDVSGVYTNTYTDSFIDLTIKVDFPPKWRDEIAYLMVFDNQKWVPVGWGNYNNSSVTFEKVGNGSCYLAAHYHNNQFTPISYPFTIDKENNLKKRIPIKDTIMENVILKRKYPFFMQYAAKEILKRIPGGKLQIANKPDFSDAIDIHVFDSIETMGYQVVKLNTPVKKHYFRYLSPPGSFVYIAEINVYDDNMNKLTGKVIGSNGSYNNNERYDKFTVFDGDPFTYFDAPQSTGCWVGLDFGKEVKISQIALLPVNDDNHIVENELYELYYFDKDWVSLGKRTGDYNFYLEYNNVPENALLLLRNHTKGKEERIFTYENNKQIWW